MKRTATAIWNGSGKEGNGTLSTQSTVLNKTQYSSIPVLQKVWEPIPKS